MALTLMAPYLPIDSLCHEKLAMQRGLVGRSSSRAAEGALAALREKQRRRAIPFDMFRVTNTIMRLNQTK
jgi:hypothetical protein